MSRPDLLALTSEAVASLSNLGLVKRAQREIDAGTGPALIEEADGTVVGTFPDGAVTRLPVGRTIPDALCTCGAANVCRHRVAVALAYRPWSEKAGTVGETGSPPEAERWSPGEIDDAALEVALGKKKLERARATAARGVLVDLSFASPPAARLPTCTVRFLVPRQVVYARCDCAEEGSCEHLALAVWAFRDGKGDGVVSLGALRVDARGVGAVEAAASAARDLVAFGVAQSSNASGRFAEQRAAARRAGMVWIESLLEELEQLLDVYHSRSAGYGVTRLSRLLVETAARARASRATCELPPRYVLGEDEAPETLLDHLRLVSLGARVRADGPARSAQVFLADPGTATVLVAEKHWPSVKEGSSLAQKSMASHFSLGALATGQLVSKAVRRRANRSLDLGASRAGVSSLTPQRGEWDALPAPILIRDLDAHAALSSQRPPVFLRPRVLAENVHVLAVGEVRGVLYDPAEQTVFASLADQEGHPFLATVTHSVAAPAAVDAAAKAFGGTVRFVSGELGRGARGWELEVLAIAGDQLVVPDVAEQADKVRLPTGSRLAPKGDSLTAALHAASSLLEQLAHDGLGDSGAAARVSALAKQLDDLGVSSLGQRLEVLAAALSRGDRFAAADAWLNAGIRTALLVEGQ